MAKIIEYERKYIEEAKQVLFVRFPNEEFKFVSFVIKISESDKFLVNRVSNKDFSRHEWSKFLPMNTQRFTRLKATKKIAKKIGKGAQAEILFEGKTTFISIYNETN